MIVGDDTRTRVRASRSEPRHPRTAPALARPREDPGARTAKRRSEKGLEQAAPRHATAPINAGRGPNAPNDAPRASPRLDHPDAPTRRRGRPWPLEHASAVLHRSPATGARDRSTTSRRDAYDFHSPRRRSKALLRAEYRSRVTYDHPRSPKNS